MAFLARLGVVLGLDSAEFSKGIENANKKLDQFSVAARTAATVGVAAFAAMTAKALQYADAMDDTAKANDMAVESIMALGQGLRNNGGNAENAAKLIASFTSKVDEAAEGSKTAQVMFDRIGLSLNDLATMDITQLFDKTAQAIASIEDPIKRNALQVQVFGRAAKGVDFVNLVKGTQEARDSFKEYADSVREAADMHDLLADKANMFMVRFTKEVIPTLLDLYDTFNKNSEVMETFWWIIREGTKVAAIIVKYLVTIVQGLAADLAFAGRSIKNLFSGDLDAIAKDYEEYQKKIQALKQSDKDFENRLFGEKPKPKATTPTPNLGRVVIDADAEAVNKAKELSAEYARQQMLKFEQVQRQTYLLELTAKEKDIAVALFEIEDSRAQKIFEIQKKIGEEKAKGIKASPSIIKALEEEIETVNVVANAYKELTAAEIKRQQDLQNSFEFGWNKAFKQYAEDAQNYAKLGEAAFNVFGNSISAAIDKFVQTGKLSFADLVKSILMGLIKIQLQMQAMQLFNSGKSWVSSLLGLGGEGNWVNDGTGFMSLDKAADGGMITGPTLVGENGPELFVPQTSGTVIPNQQLSNYSGGGGAQIVYNGPYIENLSAIDTQSATQFLTKNKNAVWAANQSASRGLPTSR